jgi:PDZ domain
MQSSRQLFDVVSHNSSELSHRVLLSTTTATLGAVVIAALLLGMVLGAVLFRLYLACTTKNQRSSSPGDAPKMSPPRRSSASAPAKQALKQQKNRPNRGNNIEESMNDVYTTTEEDNDNHDDDDSAIESNSRRPDSQQYPPEESSMIAFTEAASSFREISYGYGDEASMAGYSISGVTDAGTVQLPPSFRRNDFAGQQQHHGRTPAATSAVSFAQSTKTMSMVVQRIIKAPPGRLGITIHVTKEGPKVLTVKTGSPMEGLLFVGDVIIGINTTDTRALSLTAIHQLLSQTSNDMQRTIQVLTMDDVTRKQIPK